MTEATAPWTELLGDLGDEEERLLLDGLPHDHAHLVHRHWPDWAHDGQLAPPDAPDGTAWRTWVLMAGRGFGKTLAGAQWIRSLIEADAAAPARPGETLAIAPRGASERLSIALVGATIDDARLVMVEGRSGLLNVAADLVRDWQPTLRRLVFTTGAQATLFSGASPDRLRGPEHHFAWCDELAKWEHPLATWDMLQLGLRLGDHPRALITTTPRPGEALKRIMAERDTIVTRGTTQANPHTAAAWKHAVHNLYAGTRLGRQELEGELLTDSPGALWTVELLERCRLPSPSPCRGEGGARSASAEWEGEGLGRGQDHAHSTHHPDQSTTLIRVVIGVDPPTGDGTCGIIVCAKDEHGRAHVLADHSVTARSPEGWAQAVADAARIHARIHPSPLAGEGDSPASAGERGEGAETRTSERSEAEIPTLIVAEQNQGGRMVKAILHTADPDLHVRPVTATVGKAERAAPVAHLFEAGKVRLHGRFEALESQLLGMIAGGGYDGPGESPDRADAMVWALTELMLKERGVPSVRGL